MKISSVFFPVIFSALLISACATTNPPAASETEATQTQNEHGNQNEKQNGEEAKNGQSETNEVKKPAATTSGSKLQPFAKVIEGAERSEGIISIYRKNEKVWLELAPEDFGRLFYLKSNLDRGIGEKRIYGGMMIYPVGVDGVVQFRRIGDNVQMLLKNTRYTAQPDTPEALAVARSFSDSLLSSAPVVSQPHPERKTVLVEANALLLKDIPGAVDMLNRMYRQSYGFDARNSYIDKARADERLVVIDVNAHYSMARVAMPTMLKPGEEPSPHPVPLTQPILPSVLPDVRSLFLGFSYSLAVLPEEPMVTRIADERVGYFHTEKLDFTADEARLPTVRLINRWRLEKKNPDLPLSEPVHPITYWIDPTIPERYRQPIIAGVLEWNKAFERIGFKDAIRVEIAHDDDEFSTSDLYRPSIRWLTTAQSSFGGIGPSVVDPRSGEILDADIGLDSSQVRAVASIFGETIDGAAVDEETLNANMCMVGSVAMQEAQFGMSLLALRSERVRDDLATRQFINDYLKHVAMHEVGHTLGLRHNFHASTAYNEQQLADLEFTREHGLAGSIMEYLPWNLALEGRKQGAYQMTTIGPYDYWAIEYGYSTWSEDEEKEALQRIAARGVSDPLLVYAADEDASMLALDPEVSTQDLGSDPLAYAEKRVKLVHELWTRTQKAALTPEQTYSVLRRNFQRGMIHLERSVTLAARYPGGVYRRAARPGDDVAPMTPVPAARQRAALKLLETNIFSADSLQFSPGFLRHMAVTSFDQQDARTLGSLPQPTDIAVDQQILTLQKKALTPLMSAMVAQRLINNQARTKAGDDALTLNELYGTLRRAIWSELQRGSDIPLLRRNIQREHARALAQSLVATTMMPAEARALLRMEATQLHRDIDACLRQYSGRYSREARAHLEEVRALLKEALSASMVRTSY